MFTGYSKEFLEEMINLKEAIKLRGELIRKGEVLPATEDIVFKNLMLRSKLFLSIILEYFLGIDRKVIIENMYLENTELPVSNAKEKKKVTDIVVRVKKNVVNLEMNAKYYDGLINRNIDYILKGKSEANFSGESYDDSYIGIQINFDLDWQYDEREIIKFVLMDPERGIILSKNLIIYNINLLKFQEKYYNKIELSEFERAISLLTLKNREDLEKISEGVEGLMEAKEEIKKLSDDLGIIGVYDYEKHKEWEWKQIAKDYVKDDLVKIEEGQKNLEEGKKNLEKKQKNLEKAKKSLEEDKKSLEEDKKSLEEDKKSLEEDKKSLEEDKKSFEEKNKTFDEQLVSVAKKLLDNGFSIDEVINITGLSKMKIESLIC